MASTSTCIRSALLVLVVVACGGGHDAARPRSHPWDGVPLPSIDEMKASKSLDCVLRVTAQDVGPFESTIVDEAPPSVVRAYGLAMTTRPQPIDPWSEAQLAAYDLAERGYLDDARALAAMPEVARVISTEAKLAVGLPISMDGVKSLHMIREAALAGRRDEAARAYDTLTDADFTYAREHRIAALVALGREADAKRLVDGAPSEQRWQMLDAWVHVALRADRGVDAAIRMLIAERARLGPDTVRDGVAVKHVLAFARALGRADEVAPLRAVLIDGVLSDPTDIGQQLIAVGLADELGAIGAKDERARLAPALATLGDSMREELAAVDALRTGSLDAALAAVDRVSGHMDMRRDAHGPLWLRLWARHAVEGDTPAFESELAGAACKRADELAH